MRAVPKHVSNPPNPWSTTYVEWLEEPPAVALQVYEEEAKSILATNDSPDVPFRYSVNPYRGCQHACAYCYARTSHQFLDFGAGTDFDSKIVVKTNAAQRLREEFAKKRFRDWVAFSGITDCYQPLEASYGVTRECLEVCREFRVPVGIITKSALIRRDIELLTRITDVARVAVHISIPFANDEAGRKLEPLASSISQRFETVRQLSAAGIDTGVAIAPLIPGLNESDIPAILERARAAGATSAFMILLRLAQEIRPIFEERLAQAFPGRAKKVLSALEEMRAGDSGNFGERMRGRGERWETAWQLFQLHSRKNGLRTTLEQEIDVLDPRDRKQSVQGQLFD